MKLPLPLRPWRDLLDHFRPSFQAALGAMVRTLSQALGPVQRSPTLGLGEPEGFEGIINRGDYAHLLMSEWAFAEDFPDEFLRRSAQREQLFLQRAYRDPLKHDQLVVLFDTGPLQLGNPRLVQLAFLIAFARRAEQAKARLLWGSVQQSPETLLENITPQTIKAFLTMRTMELADAKMVERWDRSLRPQRQQLLESWVIGLPEGLDAPMAARRIYIDDLDAPDAHALTIHLKKRHETQRFSLPLPDPDARVWLLRDPLRDVAQENKVEPASELEQFGVPKIMTFGHQFKVFILFGSRHFGFLRRLSPTAKDRDGFQILKGQLPEGHHILGAVIILDRFILLARKDRELWLIPGTANMDVKIHFDRSIQLFDFRPHLFVPKDELYQLYCENNVYDLTRVSIRHPNQKLYRVKRRGNHRILAERVACCSQLRVFHGAAIYAERAQNGSHATIKILQVKPTKLHQVAIEPVNNHLRFFYQAMQGSNQNKPAYVLQTSPWTYKVFDDDDEIIHRLSEDQEVIGMKWHGGVMGIPPSKEASLLKRTVNPALFWPLWLIDASRRKILASFHDQITDLYTSPKAIVNASVFSDEPFVMLVLDDGSLELLEGAELEPVWQRSLEALLR